VRSTVKASELFPGILARRPSRACRDCSAANPPTATHTDAEFCSDCVGAHTRRCRSCAVLFIRDGLNALCLACRYQLGLFEDPE
jgi:hypothetical protein